MNGLILDDDPAIGRIVQRVGEPLNLKIDAVTTAAEFRQRFGGENPDLVILDLQIGRDDGIEQLRFLSHQGYRGPIILVSGFDARVLATAQALGNDFGLDIVAGLEKPFRVDALHELFEEVQRKSQPITAEDVYFGVKRQEMFLEFQPLVSRRPRRIHGFEALVRWNHPFRGRVPPDAFIPAAEQSTESMTALTEWVIAAAAREQLLLREEGFNSPIAINVSGRDLDNLDFPDRAASILAGCGVSPADIQLEITESMASREPRRNLDVLSRLRLKGFELAIDDFGTGYSSLRRLRESPLSILKIDRSFVADFTTSRDSMAIVKAIADLARDMNLICVAEGVETEEAATKLETFGVAILQGYFISRPLRAELLHNWCKSWSPDGVADVRQGGAA